MAFPVYVLLPEGVEWTAVPGTTAQAAKPIRWYLRQQMPHATTQTAVLIDGDADRSLTVASILERAEELGGVAVDATTQEPLVMQS